MRIAVPAEVQEQESRVAMTPEGVRQLVAAGHQVTIQRGAGDGAGFSDADYEEQGAQIAPDAASVWAAGDLIVKVKQPTEAECEIFPHGAIFFGYTHTETRPWLVEALVEREMTAISFERVRLEDGSLPLLAPMSRIAGHMSVLIGAQLLQTIHGGPGVMLGQMPGVGQSAVAIIGGGVVGEAAARVASALGARVSIFELREERRSQLMSALPGIEALPPDPALVAEAVQDAWLVVNGATVPEGSEEHVVTREMVRAMRPGAVIIDVTADLCGAVETSVRKTTHAAPTFVEEGVTHYVVPNIPGVVPQTATVALEHATLPYTLQIADQGFDRAIETSPALAGAVLCLRGNPVAPDVAEVVGR